MLKFVLVLLLLPCIALGQTILASQDFEVDGWQSQFTGESTWSAHLARTTSNPATGTYSLRWNQDSSRVDPITGLQGKGNPLLDWRGDIDLVSLTPLQSYFSMDFRHDDYYNEAGTVNSARKLFYIVDEVHNVGAMYIKFQHGTNNIQLFYANGAYSDQWARDNWGYASLTMVNANVEESIDGTWRNVEVFWDYTDKYLMIWMDGYLMLPTHPDYIANYPADAAAGRVVWDPSRDLHTRGIQIMYYDANRDLLNGADETGYYSGVQIDNLEFRDNVPDAPASPMVGPTDLTASGGN